MLDNNPTLVKRKARVIPFGYRVHPENKDWLVPIPDELEALKQAREYIQNKYPWRSVREWLIKATGRYISLTGLVKIIKNQNCNLKNAA